MAELTLTKGKPVEMEHLDDLGDDHPEWSRHDKGPLGWGTVAIAFVLWLFIAVSVYSLFLVN
jgi:hypothetical protein